MIEHPAFEEDQKATFQDYRLIIVIIDKIVEAYCIYLKFFIKLLESSFTRESLLSINYDKEDKFFYTLALSGMPTILEIIKSVMVLAIRFYTLYWEKFL